MMRNLCKFYHLQLLFWIYLGYIDQGSLGLPTLLWNVTVFGQHLTWNDAKLHCESMGQTLLTLETKDKMDSLSLLYTSQLQYSWISSDMWLGLHNVDTSGVPGNEKFYWHRECSGLDSQIWKNWDSVGSEPDRPDAQRCVRMFNNGHWRTVECNIARRYACEDFTGECNYEKSSEGLFVLPSDIQQMNITSDPDTCMNICNYVTIKNLSCWVVEIPYNGEKCILYFLSDPFHMDDPVNKGTKNADTYIRRCVNVNLDEVTTWPSAVDDVFPVSTCPIFEADLHEPVYSLECTSNEIAQNGHVPNSDKVVTSTSHQRTELDETHATYTPSSDHNISTTVTFETTQPEYTYDANELNKRIEELTNALKVDKTKTSSDIRRRISVYETRTSAVSMGLVGCIVIACILLCPILSDGLLFMRYIKRTRSFPP